jgi:hypothetical protein
MLRPWEACRKGGQAGARSRRHGASSGRADDKECSVLLCPGGCAYNPPTLGKSPLPRREKFPSLKGFFLDKWQGGVYKGRVVDGLRVNP